MTSMPRWIGWVLGQLARLVPADERDEWIREWQAELWGDAPPRAGGGRARGVGRLAVAGEDAARLGLRRMTRLLAAAGPELRITVRSLMRTPLFTLAVVSTLGLGVGANAAMFTIVDAVLLEPLPYPQADRLVGLRTVWTGDGETSAYVSTGDFDDLAARLREIERPALRVASQVTYQAADRPMRLEIAGVSSGFFELFGTSAAVGRYLVSEEDEPGRGPSAVLSHGLWQRVFGAAPDIVGTSVTLDGRPYVIVGVAERGLRDPVADVELWTSRPGWIEVAERDQPWLHVFGRLAVGASLEDARAELSTISASLAAEHPDTNAGHAVTAVSLAEELAAPIRPALLALGAVVGILLLVTCANVANLILVRAAGREREMALRISLGAGRARLTVQLLVEGLVLALLGGAVGLALAAGSAKAVAALGAPGLPRLAELGVDGTIVLFTLLVSGTVGVSLGLTPLLAVSRRDPSAGLREGGRGGEGRRVRRLRRILVGAELAASAMLLVGAGLLLRSLINLTRVETGVEAEGVAVFRVSPPQAASPGPSVRPALRAFYQEARGGISRLPGVEAVGGVSVPPFTANRMYEVSRPDRPTPRSGEETLADLRTVEPEYFRSVGIPLVQGRLLDDRDEGDAAPSAVVDGAMIRRHLPGEDPIGRRITVHWGEAAERATTIYEIVGVVGDVRHLGPASPPRPTLYVPRGHDATPYWENFGLWLTVKTGDDPAEVAGQAMRVVWTIDPTVPITGMGTLQELLDRHSTGTRHQALLVGVFALLATLLASVGIAGVVAYAVAQRGHELGVRQALGAGSHDVVRLVLAEGARVVAVGVGSGLVLAAVVGRVLQGFLFGVEPADVVTYVGVAVVLAGVALVAAWIPARRAAGVRPAVALRSGA